MFGLDQGNQVNQVRTLPFIIKMRQRADKHTNALGSTNYGDFPLTLTEAHVGRCYTVCSLVTIGRLGWRTWVVVSYQCWAGTSTTHVLLIL